VISIIKLFDKLLEGSSIYQVDKIFKKLQWLIKILSLDYPGEIRRYSFPIEVFRHEDEDLLRKVMHQRVDFDADAIKIAKIVFSSNNST
jgi:hypothetical protein